MRRYWVDSEKIENENVLLDGDLFHHIKDVCRLEVGDRFELLPGDQKAYLVELRELTKKNGSAKIIETRNIAPLARPWIHLAISIPKFQTFEAILEKSVELGVQSVHPFTSDFSFIRKIDSSVTKKFDRWNKIIKSATQQSGRGDLMELGSFKTLDEMLKSVNPIANAYGLFSYEGSSHVSIRNGLSEILKNKPQNLWVFVGSEGGFSDAEVAKFERAQLPPVTLGQQVLRVETACVALMSVIKYDCHLME